MGVLQHILSTKELHHKQNNDGLEVLLHPHSSNTDQTAFKLAEPSIVSKKGWLIVLSFFVYCGQTNNKQGGQFKWIPNKYEHTQNRT